MLEAQDGKITKLRIADKCLVAKAEREMGAHLVLYIAMALGRNLKQRGSCAVSFFHLLPGSHQEAFCATTQEMFCATNC